LLAILLFFVKAILNDKLKLKRKFPPASEWTVAVIVICQSVLARQSAIFKGVSALRV
jgi:hypothetical protein